MQENIKRLQKEWKDHDLGAIFTYKMMEEGENEVRRDHFIERISNVTDGNDFTSTGGIRLVHHRVYKEKRAKNIEE